jgi:hypothetical protein
VTTLRNFGWKGASIHRLVLAEIGHSVFQNRPPVFIEPLDFWIRPIHGLKALEVMNGCCYRKSSRAEISHNDVRS